MSGRLLSKCLRKLSTVKHFTPMNARMSLSAMNYLKVTPVYPSLQSRAIASSPALWSRGLYDADITHALDEELSYQSPEDPEKDMAPLKEFLSKNQFELQDKEGSNEVMLKKRNGDEEITVVFSLSSEVEENMDIDQVMSESEDDAKLEEANTTHSNTSVAARIAITKKNQGTLAFDVVGDEESGGAIINVYFSEERSFLLPESAHQNRQGRRRYLGPNYFALDVTMQEAYHEYITNKVLSHELLQFISNYTQLKRKREYILWLKNVGNFTDN